MTPDQIRENMEGARALASEIDGSENIGAYYAKKLAGQLAAALHWWLDETEKEKIG